MLTETMMCIPLYDDLASVIFGLYENKDERSPYALFVVGIEDDEIYVFSSENHFGQKQSKSYRDWIKEYPNKNIDEISQRPVLRHEPYVTVYSSPAFEPPYDDVFFENLFGITEKIIQPCHPICRNRVYMIMYKEKELEGGWGVLMESVCEAVIITWREYLNNRPYNTLPPRIDINKIIESQYEFREIATFFEIVTKISSLFYEKTRSKGSIAIMDSRKDVPLGVSFKTDTLSFSIEHAKQLRKLLETAKNDWSLLVYDRKINGIGEPDPFRTLYTFYLTGHMEWHIFDHRKKENGIQVLCYKHGKYYLPVDAEIRTWYIANKIKDVSVRKLVNYLLNGDHIKEFDHGAILIISDKAEEEVERLCKPKRGLRTKPISMTAYFEKTCVLCAIDGSVFLDKDGFCYGIGIILDGEAITDGTPARGSRYNSTKTYISRCVKESIEAYALIVSSDGYLDILTTFDEEFEGIKKNIQKTEVAK